MQRELVIKPYTFRQFDKVIHVTKNGVPYRFYNDNPDVAVLFEMAARYDKVLAEAGRK